ncbi:MAG: hypothetical protein Q8O34_00925 [Rhodocyclaceae bacterium]|nr:hypothetical protein [Rhodocyclaceae bacterium]
MAAISSVSGAQSGLQQLRLQQAVRNAAQAEQSARSLQAQASDARQRANQAQEDARSITVQADQAQTDAGQARLGLAVIKSVGQMQTQLLNVVAQVTEKLKIAEPAAPSQSPALPVINAQGQVTGSVINTTA